MKMSITGTWLALGLLITAPVAAAYPLSEEFEVYGYAQIWASLQEDALAGDRATDGEGNPARDVAFGFKDKRLRVGIRGDLLEEKGYYHLLVDGAGGTLETKDYWFGYRPTDSTYVQVGRFRPLVTYAHVLQSSTAYANLEESKGLERINAAFYLSNASFRDNGILIGYGNVKKDRLALLFSLTNGSGGDASVGGDVSAGSVYANGRGDAAYSVGVVYRPFDRLRVNAAWSTNRHHGALLRGGETAITIDRTVVAAGIRYDLPEIGLWLDGEYARLTTGDRDTEYAGADTEGWFVRVGCFVVEATVEAVARYETDEDRGIANGTNESPYTTAQTTIGLNAFFEKNYKAQLEYLTRERDRSDPAVEAVRACMQFAF
jgi:hypothetical protein